MWHSVCTPRLDRIAGATFDRDKKQQVFFREIRMGTIKKMKTTRLAAAAAGTILAMAALTAPAAAQQMQAATFIVVNNLFSTPAYVASENGYWAKYGLNVTVKLTNSGRAVTQAVQAGDAQFGHAALSTTIASARASGNMLTGVMAYYNAADYIAKAGGRAIIGRKDRGIDAGNPKSMEGKKIAHLTGSTNEFYLREWFRAHKLDITKSQLVSVPVENMPITIVQGQVDAIAPWEPYTAQAIRELGANAVVVSRGEAGLISDIIGVVVNEDWIKKNYDLIEKFAAGIAEATLFTRQHPKEAAEIATRYLDGLNVGGRDRRPQMAGLGSAHVRLHHRRAGQDRERSAQAEAPQEGHAVRAEGFLRRHRVQARGRQAPRVLRRPAGLAEDAGRVQGTIGELI